MSQHIKRFHLAVQALVYTGLLGVALESGTASAQKQSLTLQPAVSVVEQPVQRPDWLLPIGGISLLAISFSIEIYRHRCFLDAARESNSVQLAQSVQQPSAATQLDHQISYSQPKEC